MEDDSRACEAQQEGKAHDQETQTTFDMNGSVVNHKPPSMHPSAPNTDRTHPRFSSVPWSARYPCQPPGYPDNYYPYEAGYPTPPPPSHHHAPYYPGRNPHWHHPDSGPAYPSNHTTPMQVAPHKPEYQAHRNFYPPNPADSPQQRHTEIARPKPEWPSRAYYQFSKPTIPSNYLASLHNAHRNVHSEYGGPPPSTATSLRSTVLDVPGSSISSPRASAHLSRKRARSNTPASSIESIDLNMLIRNSPDSLLGCLAGSRLSSAGSFGHLSPLGFCTSQAYNRSGSATMQSGRPIPFITPPPIQPVKSTKSQEQPRDVYPSSTTDIPKEEATAESMSCTASPPNTKAVDGTSSTKEESMETCKLDSTTSPGASEIPVGSDNEADEGHGEVEETNLTCHWRDCTITFDNQADLVNHVNGDHIKKEKRDFTCYWQDCCREQKPFKAQYMLVVHMRRHTGEKPHVCKYEGCTKAYSRLENLKTHLRSHTGERPYVCEVEGCTKAFSNASDRAKHQNRTHSSVKPYVCKVPGCPKRYTDPSSLRKHTKTVHGDQGVKRLKSDTSKDKDSQTTTKKSTSISSTQPPTNANTANTMVQSPSSDIKSPASGSGSGTIKKAGGHSYSIVSNSCDTDLVSSTCDIGSPSVDIPGNYEGSLGVSQPAPSGLSPRSPPYVSHLPDIAEGDLEPGINESAVTTMQPVACERQSQTVTLPKIHSKSHDIASWVDEVHRRMSQTSTRRSSESSHLSVDLTGDVSRRSSESGWASNNESRRSSQTSLNPPIVPHPPSTQVSPGNKVTQGSLPRTIKTLLPPVNDGDVLRRASETSNTSSQSRTFNRLSRSSSGYGSQSNLAIIRSPMFHRVTYPLQKEPLYSQRIYGNDRTFRRLSDTVVCEADSSEMSRKHDGNKEEYRRRSEPAQNLRSSARQDQMVPLSSSFPTNEAEPRETELINEEVDPNEFDAYLSPEQLQPMARQTQPLRHFPYPSEDVHPQQPHPVESQTIHYRPNQFSTRTMPNSYYPPQNHPSPSPNRMQFQRYNSQYPRQDHQYYQKQSRLQSVPQGQVVSQYQQRPPPVMGYYNDGVSGQPQDLGAGGANYEAMVNSMEGLTTNGGTDMNVFGLGNGNMVINDMNTLLNSLLEEDKYLEMQQNSHRMSGSAMSTLF